MTRVTGFARQGDGSRTFGLTVRGLRVLVTAGDGQHDAGRELAEAIAALGPESDPESVEPEDFGMGPEALPVGEPAPAPRAPRVFVVGQRVRCNVHGAEGLCTVTEVGTGRNRGRIKITGCRSWCPVYNFDAVPS